jgi:hypothetical protein
MDAIDDHMKQVVEVVQGRPVTRGELFAAFDRVKDPEHWKNPINAIIPAVTHEEEALIRCAVIFFTGSIPTFRTTEDGRFTRVRAQGYFLAIGG